MRQTMAGTILLLAGALTVWGCGDDGPTEPRTVAGTYELRSVAGSLPWDTTASFLGATLTYEVVAGTVILREDGTYEDRVMLRMTANGATEEGVYSGEGAYTWSGSSVYLTPDGETQVRTGTVSGAELRFEATASPIEIPVGPWVYRR